MRCEIYVAGVSASIPALVSVESAIAEGRYDEAEAARSQQLSAAVAPAHEAPVHFAVEAASKACAQANAHPDDIGLTLYCSVYDTGFDIWNPPVYVQRELGMSAGPCEAAEIRSGCGAGLLGLEMACLHVGSHPERPYALVTTADCWREPVFDRWRSDTETIMGDAGSAVLLSRSRGFAKVLAVCSQTDPSLTGLSHGDEPFTFPMRGRYPIDMGRRFRAFTRQMPGHEIGRRMQAGLHAVVDRALSEAGITLSDVDHLVLPFLGRHSIQPMYFDGLGIDEHKTTFDFSRRIGHTGASDPFIGLDHLVSSKRLGTGDWIMLLAAGIGFIWTAAVLQATPDEAA